MKTVIEEYNEDMRIRISAGIHMLLKSKNLTIKEAAIAIGISNHYFKNFTTPTITKLIQILNYFDVKIDDFFMGIKDIELNQS